MKTANDFERLDETAQHSIARDYIVNVEVMLIKEIATAREAKNQKLSSYLDKKFEEAKECERQINDYEMRKYIICEYTQKAMSEIREMITAHQI